MSREINLCLQLLEGIRGVMYDVGAMRGGSSYSFYRQCWEVHAFEPDPGHAAALRAEGTGIILNQMAVMDYSSPEMPFYTSHESPGVGTLTPWLESHAKTGEVEVISLETYILDRGYSSPDFLKVDAEGHDLDVLRGYPWYRKKPKVVMCEYDHRKEGNYLALLRLLDDQGYSLIVSEYEPVQKYGQPHTFLRYHGARAATKFMGWGNIIGIR